MSKQLVDWILSFFCLQIQYPATRQKRLYCLNIYVVSVIKQNLFFLTKIAKRIKTTLPSNLKKKLDKTIRCLFYSCGSGLFCDNLSEKYVFCVVFKNCQQVQITMNHFNDIIQNSKGIKLFFDKIYCHILFNFHV